MRFAELMTDCPPDKIEVRRREDGSLDEIVAENCTIHLEQMDINRWWLAVRKDGYEQVVWFSAKGRVSVDSQCSDEP